VQRQRPRAGLRVLELCHESVPGRADHDRDQIEEAFAALI
jgi:hypothetical protein